MASDDEGVRPVDSIRPVTDLQREALRRLYVQDGGGEVWDRLGVAKREVLALERRGMCAVTDTVGRDGWNAGFSKRYRVKRMWFAKITDAGREVAEVYAKADTLAYIESQLESQSLAEFDTEGILRDLLRKTGTYDYRKLSRLDFLRLVGSHNRELKAQQKEQEVTERVSIPGLGRSVPASKPAPAVKKPTMTEYGFPYGRYEVNGRRYRFKYNPNLMSAPLERWDKSSGKGKWSRVDTKSEADEVISTIQARPDANVPLPTCTDCGKELKTADSIRMGIGPECAKKPSQDQMDSADEEG
ncbi:DUF6011 domain-containing protein [Nocardia sp. NPDC051570]|uniref:DUF6011 domain-containing protein n=1 Tax=Nocardia sp. NPDC051570 TaxID=3364324 RepID=UPI0037B8DBCC